jgi:hypothetical protein
MHNIEIIKRKILKEGLGNRLDNEIENCKGLLEIARTHGAFEVQIELVKESIAKCELLFYEMKRYDDA